MDSGAGASMQQNDEKSVEKLMDEQLRAKGLYRKKIAKDGSCLFRAVAEQVLHCQSLHTRVRAECVKYLRQKRDLYESFIEGDFEEYLHMLQDPQSWVGQVEISALAVLYKHDFIIYQQPGEPPVNITENGYPNKVLLCFLNGNHYDCVYPISSVKNAAMCQSILYELLYERVYGVDRSVLTPSLRVSKANNEAIETEERESSGDSDLDEGEAFWSSEATGKTAGVNNRTAYKGRGRGQARGLGRGCLLRKVQESLSPTLFRNVEYDVWLRSKRVQQRRDFCMAAGMHYKAGDKCQVRLNNTDRFYSAYIQDVSPDDGPVTVFIEELGEKYSVPLWNLRTPSEDSWSTVPEKSKRQTASSSNGPIERDTRPGRKPMRSVSHGPTASSGSTPGNRIQQQHSWPSQAIVEPQSVGKNGSSRRSDQGAGGLSVLPVEEDEHALLELLNKDEENFPTLEASAQAASVEGSRRAEKKGFRKKAGSDTKEQSLNPIHKAERGKQAKKGSVDQDQRISPPPKEEPNPTLATTLPAPTAPKSTKAAPASTTAPARTTPATTHALSQTTSATAQGPVPAPSQITSAAEVPGSADLSAASKSPPAPTASEQSDSAGVPTPVHVAHSITPPAQPSPSLAPSYPVGFGIHLPYPPYPPYPAPVPSLSPNISASMPDPCLPPAVPTPSFSHAAESYLYEPAVSPVTAGSGGAIVPDLTLAQLCQDMLYPGFPQNEKDEPVQPPPFSRHNTGKDLPSDTSVLRFFFNLGLKAYLYQMLPPVTYLAPLFQAYHHMQLKVSPSPVSWQPDNNSRPIFPSPNPSPAGSTPVSHFEVRGMVRTPSPMEVGVFGHHSVPMQMPLPIASHPTVYAGMHSVPPAGPSLQYSAPPPSVGPQHLSVPPPRHYGMEIPLPTVPPIMEGGQGEQRSLTPQVEKPFWAGQGQQHAEGGDIKPGAVPVTMERQYSSGAQAVLSGGVPSKGAETTMLANGNRREKGGGFVGSSLEDWETDKVEFGDADLKTRRSYHSQLYKSGGRHGQDDRGGFRGRGSRGRRDYTVWGRQDHRGSGGRNRVRGYNNTRQTGYPSGQFTPASQS
ncbi:hypothetical protein PGIGA_G00078550 [Pangasianodon gigas]|uniref:Uncharacterized protein n=1 Tax=Pangasianodon gigas TaxID=30993 RepID=A0ACC5X9L3_PANGG|nr:hypothetical protein [Pangasianodon gigas]